MHYEFQVLWEAVGVEIVVEDDLQLGGWEEALLGDLGLGIVGVELLVEVGELVDHHVHRQVASVVVGKLLVDVGLVVAFGRHHIVVVVLQEVL